MTPVALLDPDPDYRDLLVRAGIEVADSADADVWLARPDRAAEALIHHTPRWIQSTWAGVEPIVAAARQHRVLVTGLKGIFGPLVAEYVFEQLLSDVRHTASYRAAAHRRRWSTDRPDTLGGRIVTIAGTGSIGAHLARTARHFRMVAYGVRRTIQALPDFDRMFATGALREAVADARYVIACLPDTPATRDVFDAEVFARMRHDAMFVNVGRAATVDHDALARALRNERLRRAVLDVLPIEPLPAEHMLWRVPGLTITPHVAAVSDPADVVPVFLDNLARYRRGVALSGVIDLARGY